MRLLLAVIVALSGTNPSGWAASGRGPYAASGDGALRDAAASREDASLRIGAGDVVSIAVFPADEYSREVTVQPDGKIELPLVGSILIKGMAAKEVSAVLQERYARYIANPRITVNVRRFVGRRVAILGEIRNPGYYEYREGMKLLELVSLAGGLTDGAKASKVRILRGGFDGRNESLKVNFKPVLAGAVNRDVLVKPGDTVYVPKKALVESATWLNISILPWLSLAGVAATIAILADR